MILDDIGNPFNYVHSRSADVTICAYLSVKPLRNRPERNLLLEHCLSLSTSVHLCIVVTQSLLYETMLLKSRTLQLS